MSLWVAAWKAWRDPELPKWARIVPFLALLYAVSPIDLVPDFLPVVGWLDDLGIGATTLAMVLGAVLKRAEQLRAARPALDQSNKL